MKIRDAAHPARGSFGGLSFCVGLFLLVAGTSSLHPEALAAGGVSGPRAVLVTFDGLSTAALASGACPEIARFVGGSGAVSAATGSASAYAGWTELLYGSEAARTGVRDDRSPGPGPRVPALAAALARAGVRTTALPADALAHADGALARGFLHWVSLAPSLAPAARADSALAALAGEGRVFVWLAFSPGASTEPWRRVDGVGPTDSLVRFARWRELDAAFARFVAGLESQQPGRATFVVVAGCGRAAGEIAAGENVRVPLAARRYGAGTATPRPRRASAVAAALAAELGVKFTPASPSRSAPTTEADPLAWPACAGRAVWERCVADPTPGDTARVGQLEEIARGCAGARLALERDLVLSRAGREREAAVGLKAAVEAAPDDARLALAYADHLLRHGRFDVVAPALAHVGANDPFAALARWRVVMAEAAELDFATAAHDARLAAALAVPSPAAGELPARLAALAALADSVAARPEDGQLRIRYGRALVAAELFVPGYSQFHAARPLLAGSAEPDVALASGLLDQGRPQHAWATLQRALATAPADEAAHALASDVLLALGRAGEARAHLERIADWAGLEPRLSYNLACLRAAAGEREAAIAALERAFASGYEGWDQLASDPDLAAVRDDARVRALLTRAPRNPGARE